MEKRPVIKFSRCYSKLLDEQGEMITMAILLDVVHVDLQELPAPFLDYDTDCGRYRLPSRGDYLMLIFLKSPARLLGEKTPSNLFTTLRRRTHEKHEYYSGLVGQEFEVRLERRPEA